MEVAASGDIAFAGERSGGFIFPDFLPAFDAAAALVAMVVMLADSGQSVSKLVRSIPTVHIVHEEVVTRSEQKGLVMRTLVEWLGNRELVFIDGVKIPEEDGWALVLPDPEDPVTHVWAEGPSEAAARARAQQYAVRLRQLLR
jgi:mannose-1-phosphate guanylyltransferase / phosphomannomutase